MLSIPTAAASGIAPADPDATRAATVSDWFFQAGSSILRGVDTAVRAREVQELRSAGVAVGMDAAGNIYPLGQASAWPSIFGQGAAGSVNGQPAAASPSLFGVPLPSLLILAGAAWVAFKLLK
ncbi:MAG TPA: hypothetical protein P5024_12250 [Burkholderiaceae bacterium]|nr:hypothetical protein [Burkholderiaceae bacterium]